MSLRPDLMDLSDLNDACQRESQRFFRDEPSDDRFCYEIFRRALAARNEDAWASIVQNYQNLVRGWLRRNSLLEAADTPLEELVTLSYERFWFATMKLPFTRFPSLRSILQYLSLCCGSAVTDRARRARRERYVTDIESQYHLSSDSRPEQTVIADEARAALWKEVERLVRDEAEQVVLNAYFKLGMPPRRIALEYPAQFHEVQEVYRVKRNLLNRLRNDAALRHLDEEGGDRGNNLA